ncbi:MAG: DNA polymerase III subunit gamma/tau [Marinobacter sp.]|uniref:DNA polymerase III subunit gamma/tau n=1 Tax=Marinobacter sp. TaxID=50741 RepID=UPI00299D82B3|nr:DNA polymerase III subunit gamma/tau [Marinobacter sp.]MDX1634495.1 DNA polymerase III subunit gamma/tau [Marinobacter sp.]
MSYQVLARKWRPQTFGDMVGQEHVLQALVHALEHQRLHHAYLFTGTRGVGKTTIGRLLARCLNCETGITPNPCGECTSCREVQEGRFVDLIEIDAASRTGVDDMRELTDNVQYAPTRGRFKVYLIDEVHMLTTQSFNAFLKTLEEPPEHVKFLLATTDPQKLPVTVLSRCLQFNLKRMTPEHIAGHLRHVLTEEQIPFEEPALWQLARAADGSMRDALSLTDQAIAFGNQTLAARDVSSMLGTIDQRDIEQLVNTLVRNDGPALLAEIGRISDFAPDYSAILADLLSLFHRVTMEQVVPGTADNALGDAEQVQALARQLSAEDAQLFYQAALMGRKDLAITPDARMGFEMALLRMLAFRPGAERREPPAAVAKNPEPREEPDPAGGSSSPQSPVQSQTEPGPSEQVPEQDSGPQPEPAASKPAEPASESLATAPAQEAEPQTPGVPDRPDGPAQAQPPDANSPFSDQDAYLDSLTDYQGDLGDDDDSNEAEAAAAERLAADLMAGGSGAAVAPAPEPTHSVDQAVAAEHTAMPESEIQPVNPAPTPAAPQVSPEEFSWPRDFRTLGVVGMPGNLASNAAFSRDGEKVTLTLAQGHARLLTERHQDRIREALSSYFGADVKLRVVEGDPGEQTPAIWEENARKARQAAAEDAIRNDPLVKSIVERFDGRVVEGSIRPLEKS